jgi:hypothetical protein
MAHARPGIEVEGHARGPVQDVDPVEKRCVVDETATLRIKLEKIRPVARQHPHQPPAAAKWIGVGDWRSWQFTEAPIEIATSATFGAP